MMTLTRAIFLRYRFARRRAENDDAEARDFVEMLSRPPPGKKAQESPENLKKIKRAQGASARPKGA